MGFPCAELSDVCEIIMGQAPAGDAYNDKEKGYPLVAGAGDFGPLYPSVKKHTTEASKLSRAGDIILGIRASIGSKVLSDKEYCLGRGVAGLRASPRLDNRYLWHWLEDVRMELLSKGRGATFLQVNRQDIRQLQIPLPPLAEQKRIAAILDAADALRTKRREALAQLDALLQSTFLTLFGDPVANPMGWKVGSLRSVAELENGDRSSNYPSGPDVLDSGVLFLSTKNISDNQLIFNNCQFISEKKFKSLSRGRLRRNDLVITLRGTLGNCAIFDCEFETGFINAQIMIIRPSDRIISTYLHSLIVTNRMKRHFEELSTGVAVKQLTGKQVGDLSIPLPPLPLQQKFAAIVESIERQKAAQRAHLAELDALFAALQHRAFRGEL